MTGSAEQVPTARHWLVLAVATFVAASGSAFVVGIGFLLPYLNTALGMSLSQAGVLVATPPVGMASALIAWGWLVDRAGEKFVLVAGSASAAAALTGVVFTESFAALLVLLFLAGAATASGNSASGRLVVAWFPPQRRGLAMGVRQMSQPAGSAIAAMTMPLLAQSYGLSAAFALPLTMAAVSAAAAFVVVTDPPHADPDPPPSPDGTASSSSPDGTAASPAPAGRVPADMDRSPYRGSGYLQRVHGVSVMLVIPQQMLQAFLLAWLVLGHGWSAVSAGIVVTISQILGAVARVASGAVSDRVGSRMKPIRVVAISLAGLLAALTAAEVLGAPGAVAVTLAVAATVFSVSDNGLAFTAVAEYAGPRWSGRALGVQNTAQFVAISAVTPLIAAAIDGFGYWLVFAGAAVIAATAVPVVPPVDRRRV